MTTGILIAAAGGGKRFNKAGGQGNKLDAEFVDANARKRSLFAHTLFQALASGLTVQVVTRPEYSQVRQLCLSYRVPVTLLTSNGLGDSIAAGVAATQQWNGWLIHLADMPFVTPEIFRQVAAALEAHPVVRPCFDQQPGHPVGFSALLRKKLCEMRGDEGGKILLRDEKVHFITLKHISVLQDIDLPSQLPMSE